MDEKIPLKEWPIENIPDFDLNGNEYLLYRRIHKIFIRERNPEIISPSGFQDNGTGLSTNWSKYSDPYKTQKGDEKKSSENYGVVSLIIRVIRESNKIKFEIKHKPEKNNRAHTNVFGILDYDNRTKYKRNEAQVFLARIAKWEINDCITD